MALTTHLAFQEPLTVHGTCSIHGQWLLEGLIAPRSDVLPLPSGTRKRPLFPPQRVEGGVTLVDVDKGVDVCEHRHGCVAPVVVSATGKKDGEARRVPRFTLRHTALHGATVHVAPCVGGP